MAKKLIIDVEELRTCESNLRTAAEDLKDIQDTLQKAIETLTEGNGWKSNGSTEFVNKYNTSWVAGVNDRYAVMIRMCDHLTKAIEEYEPIVDEAGKLKLEE